MYTHCLIAHKKQNFNFTQILANANNFQNVRFKLFSMLLLGMATGLCERTWCMHEVCKYYYSCRLQVICILFTINVLTLSWNVALTSWYWLRRRPIRTGWTPSLEPHIPALLSMLDRSETFYTFKHCKHAHNIMYGTTICTTSTNLQ